MEVKSASASKNFSPPCKLNVLSAYCSQLYSQDQENTPDNTDRPKESKSVATSNFTCSDDIRKLSPKALMNKFAELTSDEMKKRYSYKCMILPEECSTIFKSYGSEKKAYDEMKSHLLMHLDSLETLILDGSWPPKKHTPEKTGNEVSSQSNAKAAKRFLKSEHPTGIKEPPKQKKKPLQNPQCTKKIKNEKELNVKINGNVLKKAPPLSSNHSNFGINKGASTSRNYFSANLLEEVKEENAVVEEIVQDISVDFHDPPLNNLSNILSLLSSHLEDMNRKFELKVMKEAEIESSRLPMSEKSNEVELELSKLQFEEPELIINKVENVTSKEEFLQEVIILDHSYVTVYDKENGYEGKTVERSIPGMNPPLPKIGHSIPLGLAFKCPPFPFIYNEYNQDMVQTIEVITTCDICLREQQNNDLLCRKFVSAKRLLHVSQKKPAVKGMQMAKKMEMQTNASSVLECVENRVNINLPSDRVPNISSFPLEPTEENVENIQESKQEIQRAVQEIKLLKSKKKHTKEDLQCKICNKTFTAYATVLNHLYGHAKIKLFKCEVCPKKFTRRHSLKYHKLIHENKSRFTCAFCKKQFRHPSHFKEHLRKHTGETPFECQTCSLKFKNRNTYKRHLKKEHNKLLTRNGIYDIPADITEEVKDAIETLDPNLKKGIDEV